MATEFLPLHPQNSRERKRREEGLAIRPGEAHIVQEERKIISNKEPEEKPARKPGKAHTGKEGEPD